MNCNTTNDIELYHTDLFTIAIIKYTKHIKNIIKNTKNGILSKFFFLTALVITKLELTIKLIIHTKRISERPIQTDSKYPKLNEIGVKLPLLK